MFKYKLILVTGMEVNTTDEYEPREIRRLIRAGLAIVCVTTEVQQADRRRWFVNGQHVVAWRSISP